MFRKILLHCAYVNVFLWCSNIFVNHYSDNRTSFSSDEILIRAPFPNEDVADWVHDSSSILWRRTVMAPSPCQERLTSFTFVTTIYVYTWDTAAASRVNGRLITKINRRDKELIHNQATRSSRRTHKLGWPSTLSRKKGTRGEGKCKSIEKKENKIRFNFVYLTDLLLFLFLSSLHSQDRRPVINDYRKCHLWNEWEINRGATAPYILATD